MRYLTSTALTVGLLFAVGACKKPAFKGKQSTDERPFPSGISPNESDANKKENPPEEKKPDPKPGVTPLLDSESFVVSSTKGLVDLVWTIDNSGSMKEETAQVQKNFSSFITAVQGKTNLQVALISTSKTNAYEGIFGVKLPNPQNLKSLQQYDFQVHSTNLAAIAAAASCPPETTIFQPGSKVLNALVTPFHDKDPLDHVRKFTHICDQALKEIITPHYDDADVAYRVDDSYFKNPATFIKETMYVEEADLVKSYSGKLATGFFRPEAKKVYVFVTDDDSIGITDKNFVPAIMKINGGKQPVVFSFAALASSPASCGWTARGTTYENLSRITDGKSYDICDKDWSKSFDALTEAITKISTSFDLIKYTPDLKLVNVTVDGTVVPIEKYKIMANKLSVAEELLAPGKTVKVTWEVAVKKE